MTVEASAINLARMLRFKGVSELNVTNWPPLANNALVAGLPVRVVGLDGEAGVDREIQAGFVLEVDANAVIAQFGRKLYFLNDFVFGLGKVDDFSKPSAELFAVVSAG